MLMLNSDDAEDDDAAAAAVDDDDAGTICYPSIRRAHCPPASQPGRALQSGTYFLENTFRKILS